MKNNLEDENVIKRRDGKTSVQRLLRMTPEALSQVEASRFVYVRAADLAMFSEEQILALTPEQIRTMIPVTYANLDVALLHQLYDRLSAELPEEPKNIMVEGEKRLGAKETIRQAIPKAIKRAEEKEKIENLRTQDGRVNSTDILAAVVAAKLDITTRFLYMLEEKKEIRLFKVGGKLLCDYQSVIDYLNRSRVPGAIFENGKIIYDEDGKYVPVELEPITEIPLLYSTRYFAERLNLSYRSLSNHCGAGYYDHYRLGYTIKLSEEDFERSIQRMKDSYLD